MNWNECFAGDAQPSLEEIETYVKSPLWQELRRHIEERYGVFPSTEHSICSGAPGWNIKYKKSGRALCALYPEEGRFTCLVSIGSREAMEAELLLAGCTDYVRELYWGCKLFNGGRWLMIAVTSPEILKDVKVLIGTRVHSKKKNGWGSDV